MQNELPPTCAECGQTVWPEPNSVPPPPQLDVIQYFTNGKWLSHVADDEDNLLAWRSICAEKYNAYRVNHIKAGETTDGND